MYFKIAHKVAKYLIHFCNTICYQDLSEIAQSGHTGCALPTTYSPPPTLYVCRKNKNREQQQPELPFEKKYYFYFKLPT